MMASLGKTEALSFVDTFNEDEAEKNFMLSKPVCFAVFGKPGVGKTTLASHITQAWKCIPVEALPLLEEQIATETPSGLMLQSLLVSGQSIPDELIIKMMLEKLSSTEVSHFGYIITEIPSFSEGALTTTQQIDLLKNLNLKPDIIINIKCPDYDLCQRISGQRQHSSTGHIYTRDQWDPEIIESRRKKKKDIQRDVKGEEEGEEEEEQEEEEAFIAEMQMVAEILQHLVQRPEDYLENVEQIVGLYKELLLPSLEEVMAEHNSQYLIELDGNRTPDELFLTVLDRLKYLNLKKAAIITKLHSTEEEANYVIENDELLRTLASYKLLAPRYRWQRSRWGRICPVSLKEGNLYQGSPDFAVSFLGKIYCLSSEEAMKTFSLNPRPYLLPPMPAPPFKVFVFGPPSSGKTTLCKLLAEHYKGKVIDYSEHVQPQFDKSLERLKANAIAEATEAAIKIVKERLNTQLQNKKQARSLFRRSPSENGKKETDEYVPSMLRNLEEMSSSQEEFETSQSSTIQRSSYESSQDSKYEKLSESLEEIEEVTSNHPDVLSMLEDTMRLTRDMQFEQPYEKHAEILEEVLKEVVEENKSQFPDAPRFGGWVLDNPPLIRELWTVLVEKGTAPDLVVVLLNGEENGKCLLHRLYLQKKLEIDSSIFRRLLEEQYEVKQEEEARKAAEEAQRREEEKQIRLEAEKVKGKRGLILQFDLMFSVSFSPSLYRSTPQSTLTTLCGLSRNTQLMVAYQTRIHSHFLLEEDTDNEIEMELEGEEPDIQRESEGLEVIEEGREAEELEVPEALRPEAEPVFEDLYKSSKPTAETEIPKKESKEGLKTENVFETVALPDFAEDAYPDVPEMDPFKEIVKHFVSSWKQLEISIIDSMTQVLKLEIADRTPEELLQRVIETMEKPLQYAAWEMSAEDYEEETEDYQAEVEAEEEVEGEEEEEEEEFPAEDKIKEKKRQLGDSKHFCPVFLKENFILQPGNTDEVVKYREKIYYFSTPEAKDKFLEHPEEYTAHSEPLKAPPLRICLLGPHGSGKTTCGRQLAEKFGIFHIQFDEFLQEKLMLKTERRVGPEFDEDSEEERAAKEEIDELAVQANMEIKEESPKKPPPQILLTEEEEIIKASLMDNEALPPEILESILSEWWFKEPICSTGFILDGYPRYPEEAQFLGEHGFFPDAAVFIQVDDQDVSDRLLPAQIKKWKLKQKKKSERKKLIKELKAKIKSDMMAKRRAELLAEREKKMKEMSRDDDESSEEEPEEDDDEDIENILEDEFGKEEEEQSDEDEETESDAVERLRGEMGDKVEADAASLQAVQDELEKFLIPIILINGARKPHIVQYTLTMKLKTMMETRASIFEKCYPISSSLAQKMLNYTYKFISAFGYWDPVKLSEGETIKPIESADNPLYPVIHRQYIYFLSNKETREKFMKNPIKYICQPKPKPTIPIRIAIVGPPKSGKTTVAKRFANEYGLQRLSVGDALRFVLNNQPDTELALVLKWHLYKGMAAPDELTIQALEICLMDSKCNTAGVVLDGYPITKNQMNLMEQTSIIPMIIFELDVPSKEIFRRLLLEKKRQPSLPYPLHNSVQIISIKNSKYRRNVKEIRRYYQEQHQNWHVIDGFHSKWWVWNEVIKQTQEMNRYMQTYLEKIKEGKPACIDKLCITPQELVSRLGEFEQFCPVSLAESYELVDCSANKSLELAAEFRGHYYKLSSQEKMKKFLENPELYVPPLAPHPLPSADMIPKRLTLSELKKRFPKCAELQGYCPVTYQDGKQRYEALVPGDINYAVEYRDRIYICESEEKLQKFLRSPLNYWNQKLPHKLPPLKEPITLTSLPIPGYLEQGIATSLIKAMNAAGCLKPKFPFLSIKRSALLYIAFHLKAFNPKGSEYSRKRYKKKMELFVERCELISYLGAKMSKKYKEPQFRPIDFDHKLQTFLSLRNADPVNG
ncbi:adenylate kinase 9 [Erinaceus europaeus]|uniref:Adenylate kinase 9 n=1 Tax=Erinaceus europaeus TaxID=9365 RepID=A0ABM3XDG5_ERIEU|nr:adenylate kinase 9 [Erinaceus europaeus]